MRFNHLILRGSLALLLAGPTAGPASAQDALLVVRELYASAAYEDALSAVTKIDRASPIGLDAEQYRVFCLVALGRLDEAEQAVEAVLIERPEYRPDSAEASPRIQSLFAEVRRRIGPAQVRRMYQHARAAMERKDREEAIAKFEAMLRLAADPDVRAEGSVAELQELGSGFLELSRAMAPTRPPSQASTAAPAPPRITVLQPPTVIQQRMPTWVPDSISRGTEFQGAIRVQISAEGKVISAEIVKSIHPAYDQLLLRAAKGWLYRPAQKDGIAIPIDKTVEVKVAPQGEKTDSE